MAPPVAGDVALEEIGRIGGSLSGIAVAAERLFVGVADRIEVHLMASHGEATPVARSPHLAGVVEAVAVESELLAAALGDDGLAILDADGTTLEPLVFVPLAGFANDVALRSSMAYVATDASGLRIVQVTSVEDAAEVSAIDGHTALAVAVTATHAFVAAADEGLLIVDVEDADSPRLVAQLVTGGYAYDVAVNGDLAYLADGWGGLRIIDVHDPEQPELVATVPTERWALGVAARDQLALVAAGSSGLLVVDAAVPRRPEILADVPPESAGRAIEVAAAGDIAYVGDQLAGLHVVDLSEPARPVQRSTYSPLGDVWDLRIDGDRGYVAAGSRGFRVLDLSDPSSPREVAGIPMPFLPLDAVIVGDRVLLTGLPGSVEVGESAIVAIDVSDPDHPQPGEVRHLAPSGDFSGTHPNAWPVAAGSTIYQPLEVGLLIIGADQPVPCVVGHLRTQARGELEEGYVTGAAVRDNVAYLAANVDGVLVADVTSPEAPTIVGGASAEASIGSVIATDRALFAIDGGQLVTFSLADPARPLRTGAVELPFESSHMAYGEGRLYIASRSALLAIDVSLPVPRIAGRVDLDGVISRITVHDGLVYASLGPDGLAIVRPSGASSSALLTQALMPANGWSGGVARAPDARSQPIADDIGDVGSAPGPSPESIPDPTENCVVTTVEEHAAGSLRDCLERASSGTLVSFDPAVFPPEAPGVIRITAQLPEVPVGVTIDGRGAGVILDNAQTVEAGLSLTGSSAVHGLWIRGFATTGIGVDGSGSLVSGNVLSANGYSGIDIKGSQNRIVGNRIGTNAQGTASGGFQPGGVLCQGVGNVIGGPAEGDGNLIAGNQTDVSLDGIGCQLFGNLIGTDVTGTRVVRGAVPDDPDVAAIKVRSEANVVAGNVIAGGVETTDYATFNTFIDNRVGIGADGEPLDCECSITLWTPYNRVGGTSSNEGNLIRGAVVIRSSDVVVVGNTIVGVPAAIVVGEGAVRAHVGGWSGAATNDLGGDLGVFISDAAWLNVIVGNRIHVVDTPIADSDRRVNYVVANEITAL